MHILVHTHAYTRTHTQPRTQTSIQAHANIVTNIPKFAHAHAPKHTYMHELAIGECWLRWQLWSRKWRESWKRDREEEVVLAAVQDERWMRC